MQSTVFVLTHILQLANKNQCLATAKNFNHQMAQNTVPCSGSASVFVKNLNKQAKCQKY